MYLHPMCDDYYIKTVNKTIKSSFLMDVFIFASFLSWFFLFFYSLFIHTAMIYRFGISYYKI